jgi:hypothetical protein
MNLITGDSHSEYIIFNNSTHLLCTAGSAKGLNNPNSKSQYNNTIINNIKGNNYSNLFFLFGGVDVDFCFIHKYLKNNSIDYKEFNLDVINNYLNFIKCNIYDKAATILSVGLPCLDDINLKNGLLNLNINNLENQDINILKQQLLSCELPDIYKRTEITLHFNENLMKEIIKLNNPNIKYLDITSFTYDYELKRIKNEYFSGNNHHNFNRNIHFNKIIDEYLSKS